MSRLIGSTNYIYFGNTILSTHLGMAMQLQEYVVNTDCAHIREGVDADENLTHINHI